MHGIPLFGALSPTPPIALHANIHGLCHNMQEEENRPMKSPAILHLRFLVKFPNEKKGEMGGKVENGGKWAKMGHEATNTGFAYAPVSQAHGHHHSLQCFACCTAAQRRPGQTWGRGGVRKTG